MIEIHWTWIDLAKTVIIPFEHWKCMFERTNLGYNKSYMHKTYYGGFYILYQANRNINPTDIEVNPFQAALLNLLHFVKGIRLLSMLDRSEWHKNSRCLPELKVLILLHIFAQQVSLLSSSTYVMSGVGKHSLSNWRNLSGEWAYIKLPHILWVLTAFALSF